MGNIILGQIHAMQKALKEDEELALWFGSGADRIRVFEVFLPTWKLAVLTGRPEERLVLFVACFGIAETIFVHFRRRRCVPVSMVPLRLSPAHPRPTRRPVRVSRPRKAAGGPEPVAASVRSESAVASFALLPRQRNQPSDVAAQTFPAPSSSPNPLVVSFGTKRSGAQAWSRLQPGLELDSAVCAAVPVLAGGAFANPAHGLCVSLCFGAPAFIGCSSMVGSCRSTVEK